LDADKEDAEAAEAAALEAIDALALEPELDAPPLSGMLGVAKTGVVDGAANPPAPPSI
jgi:hypothetical protein